MIISKQKYMKACCEVHNISYYGILQPNMLNKEQLSMYEQEIAANFDFIIEDSKVKWRNK